MTARTQAGWMGVILAVGMALGGCGQAGSGAGGSSFNTAAPEIKATWDKAVAADRTNDYVPAVLGYKQVLLQRDQLSPAQVKAVEDASVKLFQRLAEASSKGDPAAQQALATMRDMERARRIPQ
jgi:hypothetical protein